MKKSLFIATAVVLAISLPGLAQVTETKQEPVVEKITLQQSVEKERQALHAQTLAAFEIQCSLSTE